MENFEKIYLEGVIVIKVNLTLSTFNEAKEFRKIVEEEINSGHTNLVIDLSKCEIIDSTFFGAIINNAIPINRGLQIADTRIAIR